MVEWWDEQHTALCIGTIKYQPEHPQVPPQVTLGNVINVNFNSIPPKMLAQSLD
jgi:hypothetical protein